VLRLGRAGTGAGQHGRAIAISIVTGIRIDPVDRRVVAAASRPV
jgi:hypothetical protein